MPEQADEKRLTPMLAQYRQIKARFPDALVLFRLGDFYETFDADAKIAARELELVLTSRSFAKGIRLPMAGVPHHHVQTYIAKLIEKGYKVALVEQLEDPKKTKHLVKRDVVRVITPGTVIEDALLRPKSENYLAAIVRKSKVAAAADVRQGEAERAAPKRKSRATAGSASRKSEAVSFGFAIVDISTGDFATTQIEGADAEAKLLDELQRVQASEYVLPQALAKDEVFVARVKAVRPARISPVDDGAGEVGEAKRELLDHFHVATLDSFGCEGQPLAVSAAGAVLSYLKTNQPNGNPTSFSHLNQLWTYSLADYMTLDAATRRNLELIAPLHVDNTVSDSSQRRDSYQRSLFGVLDETVTAMGARLLKRWIHQPLLDVGRIQARLDAVDQLYKDAFLRHDLRGLLDGLYDVERLVGRIGFGNANARDLIALKRALMRLPEIQDRLNRGMSFAPQPYDGERPASADQQDLLRELEEQIRGVALNELAESIDRAVVNDPPIFLREGGLIKSGYDARLDELREGATDGKRWLDELEERERRRTGIKSLRVRYNEVFGFFIEAPRSLAHLIPDDYERRATITHAERYVTPELKAREAHILAVEERAKDLEYDLFIQVRQEVARHSARLKIAARLLAQLDALCALAEAAARFGYVKPVVDDSDVIEIREGRHPVVERANHADGDQFVPNDVRLDAGSLRVIILTGPNMSGKSVFVRQVALITLMAQIGSFVPASEAHIGVVDRIFTRVGASDDIAQGRSTFLVEMSEASHILRHATPRSLIILDEVGRGTSTYDGISLAWAIAEDLHNSVGAKTLFATHYHELTELEADDGILTHGAAVKNYTMAVHERAGDVVFLRQVVEGGAEKSFGIHVARLAGLPNHVIARAEEVLEGLEQSRGNGKTQIPNPEHKEPVMVEKRELFRDRAEVWRRVLSDVAQLDIANLTPIEALNLLNEMQLRVRESTATGFVQAD